ncbi:MAG: penicillin-binding protein activator LpoB [Planctomycetes bacterium]|nr:penicillin-binding protein activator LpoB [Planctomycetota bacterium]
MRRTRIGTWVLSLATVLGACSSETILRDPNNPEQFNEKLGYTDVKETTEKMVRSMLTSAPLAQRTDRPILIYYGMANRTSEHFDTQQIYNLVSTVLTQSGKVQFVDIGQRSNIAEEVGYQQSGNVSPETARRLGQQTGAEFLLTGDVSSIIKNEGNRRLAYYQILMKLTNLKTSIIEWQDIRESARERIRPSTSW